MQQELGNGVCTAVYEENLLCRNLEKLWCCGVERGDSRSRRSAAFAGASATIRKSNGTRGLTNFGVIRFASGPWKSKVRKEPTPNT